MAEVIEAQLREITGKGNSRRLRAEGLVPAVVYGKGSDSTAIQLAAKDLENILSSETGRNTIIELKLKGNKSKKRTVMIREIQRDPVKGRLLHADLYEISLKDKVHTVAPLHLVGESPGVKMGGVLQQVVREVEIECLPADIPEFVEVDISQLEIGGHIAVGDLPEIEGIKILSDPESIIVTVVAPRLAEAPAAEEGPEERPAKEAKANEAAEKELVEV